MKLHFLVLFSACLVFAGCSRDVREDVTIETAKDLVGRKCAVVVGSMMGDLTVKAQPGIDIEWFNDYNSGIEAVRLGKVAAMPLDFFYARRWAQQNPSIFAITKPYQSIPWAYLFAKGSPLRDKVNAILAKMRASGDLDRILSRWSESSDPGALQLEKLDYRKDFTGKAGVLRFATPGDREPVCFMRSDGLVGFDIDLVRRIAYELDMTLELVQISMGALVTAVQSGKADMGGGGMAITEERAEKVDFSECYYRVPTVFLIRVASAPKAAALEVKSLADMKGRTCAAVIGTALQELVERRQSGVLFKTFNDYPSALEAVRLGKVDAMPIDTVLARRWVAQRPKDIRLAVSFDKNPYGYFFPKGSPLRERVNAILRRMMASGQIDRIVSKWCDAQDVSAVTCEPVVNQTAESGVLRFATTGDYEPGSFPCKGEIIGFDIDLMRLIAAELGLKLELVMVNMSALVPAVQSGKADMGGGCITITESRKENVDFTDAYLDEGFSLVVRNNTPPQSGMTVRTSANLKGAHVAHLSNALESLKGSFVRTFVTERRWKMLADGLGVTLLITTLSAFFGTLLAFFVWKARTSSVGPVVCLARWYISVLQGTPVLVLLMILFYLVFGSVDISGIWVAVIGFSLNASAYIGEMLRSGIDGVPRGQTEAALALGYGPRAAFFRFVLPQAVRQILPVYRGELIGLLKSTSIVGYIAINDLTKASDLVRSRTYESFFPILTTAFIYFVAAWLLAAVLDRVGRWLDPANAKNRIESI